MEPVIEVNMEEIIDTHVATRKGVSGKYATVSTAGKQLYEKIQEQKYVEAQFDPTFDYY
jgi:fluoride ion exporter CrcB/FEX